MVRLAFSAKLSNKPMMRDSGQWWTRKLSFQTLPEVKLGIVVTYLSLDRIVGVAFPTLGHVLSIYIKTYLINLCLRRDTWSSRNNPNWRNIVKRRAARHCKRWRAAGRDGIFEPHYRPNRQAGSKIPTLSSRPQS